MRKTLLIARREYLAFIRTVGFWLSLVTAPLIFGCIIAVPILIRQTAPVDRMSVAILDLTGVQEAPVRALIQQRITPPPTGSRNTDFMHNVGQAMFKPDDTQLVPLPAALNPGMSLKDAEDRIPALMESPAPGQPTTILVIYDDGDILHFHIWSTQKQRNRLQDMVYWDLDGRQYYKMAGMHGIDPALAHDMRETRAQIMSLTPRDAVPGPHNDADGFGEAIRDNAPRMIGAIMGYISWMTIFSSSMILLGGVIEEKASKVLEVLLASVSTESLLIGKVLGVAAVLATVGAIWGGAAFAAFSMGAQYMPSDMVHNLSLAMSGLFTPQRVALLAAYFIGGYLMFGVTFAAIGAFCETQKDAQAIMGPIMIVLMVPMMTMQAALLPSGAGSPLIQWLSYVPIFAPFLMPLRLAEPLPMWEIVVTLGGMALAATGMIMVGRRAFKQGALTGGKLSWGLLAKIAVRKSV